MTNPRTYLAGIKERAERATEGPWVNGGLGLVETIPEFDLHRFDIMPETIARAELRYEDAEFISAARTDLPRVADALLTVLELHQPVMEDGEPVGCACCDWDQGGNEVWPCATVKSITEALEASL